MERCPLWGLALHEVFRAVSKMHFCQLRTREIADLKDIESHRQEEGNKEWLLGFIL